MEKLTRDSKAREQKDCLAPAMSPKKAVKMNNCISIIGVSQREMLARGLCPHCKKLLDLWITEQGLELSSSHEISSPEPALDKGSARGFIKLKLLPSWLPRPRS